MLSVGRKVEKKGYGDLLDALARLPRSLHWRFEHIGAGGLSDALKAQGITVEALIPHSFGENPHNSRYLETKRDRQGHRL